MPKKTLRLIIEGGNDYVAHVKGNQPHLVKALNELSDQSTPEQSAETTERSRGRKENRRVELWRSTQQVAALGWNGVRTILRVQRWGKRGGQQYHEVHWYIASIEATAEVFLKIVRLHWQVENNCHWVKDVVFGEDTTPTPDPNANRVFALLRNIVINLYRRHGHYSMKYAIEQFTNLVKELYELFRT